MNEKDYGLLRFIANQRNRILLFITGNPVRLTFQVKFISVAEFEEFIIKHINNTIRSKAGNRLLFLKTILP